MTRIYHTITHCRHHEDNQLLIPHHDDCKTRKDTKYCITKQGPNTEPPQTKGAIINNESTTIEPLP